MAAPWRGFPATALLLAAALLLGGCRMPWSDDEPSRPVPMPRADAPTRVGPLAERPAAPLAAAPAPAASAPLAKELRPVPPLSRLGSAEAAPTGAVEPVSGAQDVDSNVFAGAPTHGAQARQRAEQLDAIVRALLGATLPAIEAVRAGLAGAVQRLDPPQALATNEAGLRDWHGEAIEDFQRKIDALYDVTRRQLENLHDVALATAEQQAVALAPPRTVLDDGPTGDRILDMRMTALAEVVDNATGLDDLRAEREQDRGRAVELIEVFNTFADVGAEETLDGRLLLFIGGDADSELPRCVLAYRHDGPGDPGAYAIAQVVRHRIMRGDAVVQDLDWRAAPTLGAPDGFPLTEVHGNYLVAPEVQPLVDRNAPNYDRLRDLRVVADTQTALIAPDGRVLSGVDWRVQFSISARGDLTWDISGGHPVYDPWCTHVKHILGQRADG